ncbi:MAG: beta-galactosidase [Clostridia bacterium]|nr:beta-galactosidase [Clostridia bacterium]
MRIGVDYYPEHWDRALWRQDAELMRETGVRVVRVAEFAWSRLEPEDGRFDFAWLDEVIELMGERGIDVVIGTPTSCPPLWLFEAHPEISQADYSGQRDLPGIRGHRCYQSPVFREYAGRIVRRLAERYRDVKHVIAWQIDNEVEGSFCCCDVCVGKFREWLKRRYGTLEAMNAAFHTDVWSGDYSAWSQVFPPVKNHPMTQYNPGLILDFQRFASQSTEAYVAFQRELIRSIIPGARITTNSWFCEHLPDLYSMYRELDFASYDNYPSTVPDGSSHALHLDLMRGVKRRNFWIMEQLSGLPGCWMNMGRAPQPGMVKGYALQAIAHGADTVVHFRWRCAVGGAEMYWHGLIDHSNVPGRRFKEFEALCEAVRALAPADGSRIESKVALLFGMDNEYAFRSQLQAEGMYYMRQLADWHKAFTALGVNVDVIDQNADLDGYGVVVAPTMYVRSETAARSLHTFAERGGTVLLTCRSGVKDVNNNCIMAPLPTDYADMVGAHVAEYDALGADSARVRFGDEVCRITCWADILESDGAEVVATYLDGFYAGAPAVTRNRYGAGKVYYFGVYGEAALCRGMAERMLKDAGLAYRADLPEGVELVSRTNGDARYTFIFNNGPKPAALDWEGKTLALSPYALRVPELGDFEL